MTPDKQKKLQMMYMKNIKINEIAKVLCVSRTAVMNYVRENKLDVQRKLELKKMQETAALQSISTADLNARLKKEHEKRNKDIVSRITDIESMMTGKMAIESGKTMRELVSERNSLMIKMHSFLNNLEVRERDREKWERPSFNPILGR